MCDTPFLPGVNPLYKEDFSLANRVNFYERSIAVVKRLKTSRRYLEVNQVKSTYKRWFENFKEIESHIFKGRQDIGVYRLRRPYRNVRIATSSIEDYAKVLSYLEKNSLKLTSSRLDSLNVTSEIKKDILSRLKKKDLEELTEYIYKKQKRQYQRLGFYYNEYKYYNENLSKLYSSFECKKECKSTIDKLKESLGLHKASSDIQSMFNSSSHAIVAARKKEFLNESFGFVRGIISRIDFTKSIMVALEHKGLFEKSRLVKLFKSSYDKKARNLHRSMIDKISLAKLTPKQRFDLLKKELISYSDESLVVNFARAEDYYATKAWNEIKSYVNKTKDLEFYNLISKSEAIAKRLGRVGSYNLTRVLKNSAFIVGTAASVIYLVGSGNEPEITEEESNSEEDVQVIHLKYESKESEDIFDYMRNVVDEIDRAFK